MGREKCCTVSYRGQTRVNPRKSWRNSRASSHPSGRSKSADDFIEIKKVSSLQQHKRRSKRYWLEDEDDKNEDDEDGKRATQE
jgi:hypothetical protein